MRKCHWCGVEHNADGEGHYCERVAGIVFMFRFGLYRHAGYIGLTPRFARHDAINGRLVPFPKRRSDIIQTLGHEGTPIRAAFDKASAACGAPARVLSPRLAAAKARLDKHLAAKERA